MLYQCTDLGSTYVVLASTSDSPEKNKGSPDWPRRRVRALLLMFLGHHRILEATTHLLGKIHRLIGLERVLVLGQGPR